MSNTPRSSAARSRHSTLLMLTVLAGLAALSSGCSVTFPEQGRSTLIVSTSRQEERGRLSPSALSYDDHPWHDR